MIAIKQKAERPRRVRHDPPTERFTIPRESARLSGTRTALRTDFSGVPIEESSALVPLTSEPAPTQGKSAMDKKKPEQEGAGAPKTKENWSRSQKIRHKFYDFVKFFVTRLKPIKNPYNSDDINVGGAQLTSPKEIFLGGTKPMFKYKNAADKKEKWLFKEAVNCVGGAKPTGAAVSEAAFRVQELVDPESAVPTYQDGSKSHGLGSFQKRVDVDKDATDYFDWQKNPAAKPLESAQSNQILREHVTDWLLCNYDTKGENFLTDKSGKVRGIDKEQSLRYMDKKGAAHMSKTYKPNPTQTLYNVIFQKYAAGEMDLDLNQVDPYIQRVEKEEDKESYLNRFARVLDLKKGESKEKLGNQLWDRKQNLREEYRSFFTQLELEREKNKGGTSARLGENGKFKFDSDDR